MIRSMTGFGRSQMESDGFALRVEARTVNSRGFRATFRLAERLQGLEPELERLVRARIARGTVTVQVVLDGVAGDPGYVLDEGAVAYYRGALEQLGKSAGCAGGVSLDTLVGLPGVLRRRSGTEETPETLVKAAMQTLGRALDELVGVREQEGANIWQDILLHCERIAALVDKTAADAPEMVAQYRARLVERLRPLLAEIGGAVSEDDVRREVVFFADRADVSEEITRLRSHLELMRSMAAKDESCGRQVEFVAQEMFREANTMASKANDPKLAPTVLEIKSEVEKIREQALNVE